MVVVDAPNPILTNDPVIAIYAYHDDQTGVAWGTIDAHNEVVSAPATQPANVMETIS